VSITKLEFQDISHFASSLLVLERADQIIVHVVQHNKARTTIFLHRPQHRVSIMEFCPSLGRIHELCQSFQNLLLIEEILDLMVPYVKKNFVQLLSFVQVSKG